MHPVILLLLSSITTDWVWLLIFTRFLEHTQRRTTVGRTPLNEWSVRRRDLYLTTHNNHNKHPCPPTCWEFLFTIKNTMTSAGFEPANLGTKGQRTWYWTKTQEIWDFMDVCPTVRIPKIFCQERIKVMPIQKWIQSLEYTTYLFIFHIVTNRIHILKHNKTDYKTH